MQEIKSDVKRLTKNFNNIAKQKETEIADDLKKIKNKKVGIFIQ